MHCIQHLIFLYACKTWASHSWHYPSISRIDLWWLDVYGGKVEKEVVWPMDIVNACLVNHLRTIGGLQHTLQKMKINSSMILPSNNHISHYFIFHQSNLIAILHKHIVGPRGQIPDQPTRICYNKISFHYPTHLVILF